MLDQIGVHQGAQGLDAGPLFFGVGLGHARRLVDARDLHLVAELDLALVHAAFDRCGARRLRGAGQRNMAFTGEQAGGRVQPDPAGAGQEDLAPGVQVGEVLFRAAGAVEGLHVGRELDQVARDEARRQAQVAQQLHQQPARVAAGTALERERFLRRLHARLQPNGVGDVLPQLLVDADQEVDGALLLAIDFAQVALQQRRERRLGQVGGQLLRLGGVVLEREFFGPRLQEEVERVVDRHFHHQVDGDLELGRRLGEDQARLVIGERVLLPVDEMGGRLDALRIRQHLGAAVRRGPQADDLRPEFDQAVVPIMGDVAQGNVDGHARGFRQGGCNGTPRGTDASRGALHE